MPSRPSLLFCCFALFALACGKNSSSSPSATRNLNARDAAAAHSTDEVAPRSTNEPSPLNSSTLGNDDWDSDDNKQVDTCLPGTPRPIEETEEEPDPWESPLSCRHIEQAYREALVSAQSCNHDDECYVDHDESTRCSLAGTSDDCLLALSLSQDLSQLEQLETWYERSCDVDCGCNDGTFVDDYEAICSNGRCQLRERWEDDYDDDYDFPDDESEPVETDSGLAEPVEGSADDAGTHDENTPDASSTPEPLDPDLEDDDSPDDETEQTRCEATGGIWDPTSCGHYSCGQVPLCRAIIPGCNCGSEQNFGAQGCQPDPECSTQ